MAADVAIAKRAENGIDQRVNGDVGIAVARQAVAVGNAQAAEPQFLTRDQAMNVEPGADPRRRRAAAKSAA